ncbi:MAG TPA: hypothetical protein ENK57_17190 [Polyangiaceae bacterium]|nr:hypothetical protein [Polyangiaceae bacterium]
MTATKTLSQIITRARRRTDMVTGAAGDWISDDEAKELANSCLAQLWGLLLRCRGHEHYIAQHDFQTASGTSDYTLPVDFLMARKVLASGDRGHWIPCRQWDFDSVDRLLSADRGGDAGNIRYRAQGAVLSLLPQPASVFDVRVYYYPRFVELEEDGDTFDGVNGWEEWAAIKMAEFLAIKDGSDPSSLIAERKELEAQIIAIATRRSTEPARIQDTRRDHVFRWGNEDTDFGGIRYDTG